MKKYIIALGLLLNLTIFAQEEVAELLCPETSMSLSLPIQEKVPMDLYSAEQVKCPYGANWASDNKAAMTHSMSFAIPSQEKPKTVLICGAGGFIGSHLVTQYKQEGYWVRGVDTKYPEFSKTDADEFIIADLRFLEGVDRAFSGMEQPFDEVCQLAANMGGMGFIAFHDAEIMHDSALININVLEKSRQTGVGKIFYSGSACAYPTYNQLDPNNPICTEDSAYPALPDSEYGWEKLFSERLYLSYARDYGMDVRIARLHNVFGPKGTWDGERAKAPASLCRKVAAAHSEDTIEVWGKGDQTRSFLYIDECIEGIRRIMKEESAPPVLNLGSDEMIAINDLVLMIAQIAGKKITIKNIDGPEGVRGRNSDNRLIEKTLGWRPTQTLEEGFKKLYPWIEEQVKQNQYN